MTQTWLSPWRSDSLWSTPLPASPELMPDSADRIALLVPKMVGAGVICHDYGVAAVRAGGTAYTITKNPLRKSYDLSYLNSAGPVRIPTWAKASRGTDQHLSVIDLTARRAWDMGGFAWIDGKPVASYGHTYSIDDHTGIAPRYLPGTTTLLVGATAANFPLLGGLVRPHEIQNGVIRHRLTFCTACRQDWHYFPATRHGGLGTCGISEGSLTWWDGPVDSLSIPAWQKMYLTAWHDYGAYHRDGGGHTNIYGEDDINRTAPQLRWADLGLGSTYNQFSSSIPWNRLRVLTEEMSR